MNSFHLLSYKQTTAPTTKITRYYCYASEIQTFHTGYLISPTTLSNLITRFVQIMAALLSSLSARKYPPKSNLIYPKSEINEPHV